MLRRETFKDYLASFLLGFGSLILFSLFLFTLALNKLPKKRTFHVIESQILGSSNAFHASTQSGLININTASSVELDLLPQIGEKTAQKIIENRPYEQIDELKTKKIVSKNLFEKIKNMISTF